MDMARRTNRQLRIGDSTVKCSHLELELQAEINELIGHIDNIKRRGSAENGELEHMKELLNYREAVLEWLQTEGRDRV